ncbi:MAG: Hpt domain-containing protein [Magnetovibrio sp.]|nr:Hpt domain-containing protein [Magnetovibrio sp.]
MFKNGVNEAQIIANLRGEFLEDARKRLDLLNEARVTASRADDPEPPFKTFRQELHTLKGMGQSFGFGSITLISRRLEENLKDGTAEGFSNDETVPPYLAAMDEIVDAGEEPSDDEIESILEALPLPSKA